MLTSSCPSCGGHISAFCEIPAIPVNSCILMSTADEARGYPRGDIVLGFCDDCGFICNLAFDQQLAEYSGRYEETQGFSATFQRYHRALAQDLISRYGLHNKTVLEIGCGKGEFLALLCDRGLNRGLGFDPGYDGNRGVLEGSPTAEVIVDFYSERYATHRADFVCCKMTLEHIPQPAAFVGLSRLAMRPGASSVFYLQVPEALRIFRDCVFEDIYYEHCCYFTAGSLSRLFRSQGLEPRKVYTSYADQYLAIEASVARGATGEPLAVEQDLDEVRALVATFPQRSRAKISNWQQTLANCAARGSVILWGSGSKAVAFLGAVDKEGTVDRVVDINPYRQGHFMPGSAQPIVAPAQLQKNPPAAVIVMNPIYREEVAAELEALDLQSELMTL
jgi:SAM-dependent methyltransferase